MNRLSKEELLEKMLIEINGNINEMAVELDAVSNKLLRVDAAIDQFQEDSRLMFKVLARINNHKSVRTP
jgi:hypothetical protein